VSERGGHNHVDRYPPEVETEERRHAANTNQNAPAAIHIGDVNRPTLYWSFIYNDYDKGNQSGSKGSPSLRRENRSHHAASDARGSELGRYYGGEGVVTTDSNTSQEAPYDELK